MTIACLSDMHFGEPYSLLRSDWLVYAAKMVGYLAEPRVSKLILLGDVFELAVPEWPDAAFPSSRLFFHTLLSDPTHRLAVDEIVWIPGNHDHALWSWYAKTAGRPTITTTGETLLEAGRFSSPTAQQLVTQVCGEEGARLIRRFSVAYPYLIENVGGQRILFHHGHLFDDLILGRDQSARTKAWITSLFSGRVEVPRLAMSSHTLEELDKATSPFIDQVWARATSRQTLKSQSWEVLMRFDRGATCAAPVNPGVPQYADVGSGEDRGDMPREAENAIWFLEKFVEPASLPSQLVYGHTHGGGRLRVRVGAADVELVNTGGWVTSQKSVVPHSHLLMVDDKGSISSRAIRFPGSVIAESVDHGRSARTLDVALPEGRDVRVDPSLF